MKPTHSYIPSHTLTLGVGSDIHIPYSLSSALSPLATEMSGGATSSAARTILQKRAVSCSFSSVFHLQQAGMSKKDFKQTKRVFQAGIILPAGLVLSAAGVHQYFKR